MKNNLKVEILDDNGNAFEVAHLLTFEHEKKHYIAFGDVVPNEQEAGVYIFRIEEKKGDNDVYLPIENPIELEEAWSIFKDIYYEEDDE